MRAAGSRFMDTTLILLAIPLPSSFSLHIRGGIHIVQSMKPVLLALLAFCLLLGGCKTTTKYNPFITDSYCEKMFGYPSEVIARILVIEKPIGPKDMPPDEDYD